MKKVFLFMFIVLGVFFFVSPVFAFYPFGGLIGTINPPTPVGPCPSISITVGSPKPGIFMLPPGMLFAWFRLLPGRFVLGLASSPLCGTIFIVGTS